MASEEGEEDPCMAEFNQTTTTWNLVIYLSLGLALGNIFLFFTFLRDRLEGAPSLSAQYHLSTGAVKLLLGILIVTVFRPVCPEDCPCEDLPYPQGNYYGVLAILAGLLWVGRGVAVCQRARELQANADIANEDVVFAKVDVEMS